MTNKERKEFLYTELEKAGRKPAKAVNFCKSEDLEAEYKKLQEESQDTDEENNNLPASENNNNLNPEDSDSSDQEETTDPIPTEEQEPEGIPTLKFKNAGWCEALGKSYYRGTYKPKSLKEYEALKPYAEQK